MKFVEVSNGQNTSRIINLDLVTHVKFEKHANMKQATIYFSNPGDGGNLVLSKEEAETFEKAYRVFSKCDPDRKSGVLMA